MTDTRDEAARLVIFSAFNAKVDGRPIDATNMPVIKRLAREEIVEELEKQLGVSFREMPR